MKTTLTLTFRYLTGVLGELRVSVAAVWAGTPSIEGVHVAPHQQSPEMHDQQETDFSLGARVELFPHNASEDALVLPASVDVRLRGRVPSEPLASNDWAWHDVPPVWGDGTLRLAPGMLTGWTWNGKRQLGHEHQGEAVKSGVPMQIRIRLMSLPFSASTRLSITFSRRSRGSRLIL